MMNCEILRNLCYKIYLSQSRRLPPLQVVSNSKFVSVRVQSPTEINAPRGCAVILIGICQLRRPESRASLTDVQFEIEKIQFSYYD